MNAVKQALWLFIALISLACSGWYFSNKNQAFRLDKETLSTTVDATITDLTVHQFDAEGHLVNLLTTPLMQHIPKDDVHLLQNPLILIQQGEEPAWEISALKARSINGGKEITFTEHVIVHQNPGNKSQESTLKTEEVTYYPNEKKATSSLFVSFEQPGNTIQSTGMTAWLEEKRIELLHQARGSYVPAKG